MRDLVIILLANTVSKQYCHFNHDAACCHNSPCRQQCTRHICFGQAGWFVWINENSYFLPRLCQTRTHVNPLAQNTHTSDSCSAGRLLLTPSLSTSQHTNLSIAVQTDSKSSRQCTCCLDQECIGSTACVANQIYHSCSSELCICPTPAEQTQNGSVQSSKLHVKTGSGTECTGSHSKLDVMYFAELSSANPTPAGHRHMNIAGDMCTPG